MNSEATHRAGGQPRAAEMLEWMLKLLANKLLGIVEMDTSTMTQEEIKRFSVEEAHAQVKKEIDKREGRVDVFFAALEKARDDSLSIEDRAAAARPTLRPRIHGSPEARTTRSRRVQGPEQLQPRGHQAEDRAVAEGPRGAGG